MPSYAETLGPSDGAPRRAAAWLLTAQLSAMMFLQYAVWGAWAPVLAKHLEDIGLSGVQIGHIYGTMAIASMISPWLGGQLADRLLRAEHVLFGSHLLGAAALWAIAEIATPGFGGAGAADGSAGMTGWLESVADGESRFGAMYVLALAYALLYVPTIALTNTVAFRHLTDRDRQFGWVRLWGTIGWIAASWALGVWLAKPAWLPAGRASLDDCLRLAAVLSGVLALYSLLLPRTPPVVSASANRFAALAVLKLLRHRSFLVLIIVGFLLAVAMPFYYQLSGPFLGSLGVTNDKLGPLLTIGQICEIVVLAAMALVVRLIGVKAAFLVGIACWAARFGVFSAGGPWPVVVGSLALHGFCFAFVFALGQIYVDRHAEADVRASAQSFFAFVTLGVGMFAGNYLAGLSSERFKIVGPSGPATDYAQVFLWPAVAAAVCFFLFAALFTDSRPRQAAPS